MSEILSDILKIEEDILFTIRGESAYFIIKDNELIAIDEDGKEYKTSGFTVEILKNVKIDKVY